MPDLSTLHLFSLSTLPDAIGWFLILVCIPYAVAYYIYKKGYSFWLFFAATLMSFGSLLSLLAIIVIAVYLPKREKAKDDAAEKNPAKENPAKESEASPISPIQKNETPGSNNAVTPLS